MDRKRTDLYTLLVVIAAVAAIAFGVNHIMSVTELCTDFDPATSFDECFTEEVQL